MSLFFSRCPLDAFLSWWRQEGLEDLVARLGDPVTAGQIKAMARAAYLQGQIDGGACKVAEDEARDLLE